MYMRHQMLKLSNDGIAYAVDAARNMNAEMPISIESVINSHAPAIVKRQNAHRDGFIEVGFSSYFIINGNRVRLNSIVPTKEVVEIITPFDAVNYMDNSQHLNIVKSIYTLKELALKIGIAVGVYGSCSLEFITYLPYINENSDIDIYVKSTYEKPDYFKFNSIVEKIEDRYKVKFDIEVECKNGFAVKLKELISNQKTVICKGLFSVELQNISEIIN